MANAAGADITEADNKWLAGTLILNVMKVSNTEIYFICQNIFKKWRDILPSLLCSKVINEFHLIVCHSKEIYTI